MDMFMDKLAQKLTAQEIIKANTTAETEELNRLRNQIEEYDRCLERLQQLLDEGAEKLQGGATENSEINLFTEESMEKINSCLRQSAEQNEQLQAILSERLEGMEASLSEHFEEADRKLGERLGNVNRIMSENLENMDRSMEEQLNDMDASVGNRLTAANESVLSAIRNMESSMGQKFSLLGSKLEAKEEEKEEESLADQLLPITENIHRECVKVYRNVQAVVLEENGKQSDTLADVNMSSQRMTQKLGTVFAISLASLIVSAIGLVLQFIL